MQKPKPITILGERSVICEKFPLELPKDICPLQSRELNTLLMYCCKFHIVIQFLLPLDSMVIHYSIVPGYQGLCKLTQRLKLLSHYIY